MNPQMKRGFLEACVLATLARGKSYGYRIVKDAPNSLELTESTLYPVLKRLEAAKLISSRSVEHNGRLRKYYRVTEGGLSQMRAFVAEREEVEGIYRFVERALACPVDAEGVGALGVHEERIEPCAAIITEELA